MVAVQKYELVRTNLLVLYSVFSWKLVVIIFFVENNLFLMIPYRISGYSYIFMSISYILQIISESDSTDTKFCI